MVYTVSLNSGKPEQVAAVNAEMEQSLGFADDPLEILIAQEEDARQYDPYNHFGRRITQRHRSGEQQCQDLTKKVKCRMQQPVATKLL